MSDGGRARWRRRFRLAAEREVRFAKLTVKLLLAAELKEDVTIQLVELRFARYQEDCQLVSKIIARMVAIIENDAREPREILAKGPIPFLPDDWWIEFTAGHFFGNRHGAWTKMGYIS